VGCLTSGETDRVLLRRQVERGDGNDAIFVVRAIPFLVASALVLVGILAALMIRAPTVVVASVIPVTVIFADIVVAAARLVSTTALVVSFVRMLALRRLKRLQFEVGSHQCSLLDLAVLKVALENVAVDSREFSHSRLSRFLVLILKLLSDEDSDQED